MRPLRTLNKRFKHRFWKALAQINRQRGALPSVFEAMAKGADTKALWEEREVRWSAAVALCGAGPAHRRGGLFKNAPKKGWAKKVPKVDPGRSPPGADIDNGRPPA